MVVLEEKDWGDPKMLAIFALRASANPDIPMITEGMYKLLAGDPVLFELYCLHIGQAFDAGREFERKHGS